MSEKENLPAQNSRNRQYNGFAVSQSFSLKLSAVSDIGLHKIQSDVGLRLLPGFIRSAIFIATYPGDILVATAMCPHNIALWRGTTFDCLLLFDKQTETRG